MTDLIAKPNEHRFAPYVRILGKGKTGSRSLTREEARMAMEMILRGQVKGCTTRRLFNAAARQGRKRGRIKRFRRSRTYANKPRQSRIGADLDWSSYAGKRKHLPWFLTERTDAGGSRRARLHARRRRTYQRPALHRIGVLNALGIASVRNLDGYRTTLSPRGNSPSCRCVTSAHRCKSMIDLRNEFGLRSPVHTLSAAAESR